MFGYSSFAFKDKGELWAWGDNSLGMLGTGNTVSYSSPVLVVGNHNFIQLYTGEHTVALKSNGEAWAWGYNTYGQLGDNSRTIRYSPVPVIGNHKFIQISAGRYHTLGLKSNGEIWGWGYNSNGELGGNTTSSKSSPVLVVGDHSFVQICAGYNNGYGLKSNGEIWAWGSNNYGQVGDGNLFNRSSPVLVVGSISDTYIKSYVRHSFIYVTAGGGYPGHALGLKSNGEVWSWGYNSSGQLGNLTRTSASSPVLVVGNHSFIHISAGIDYSLGLKSNGQIWSWGLNTNYRLGTGNSISYSSPVLVIGNHSFKYMSCSQESGYGLKSNGELWAWGYNNYGQIGDDTRTARSSPVLVIGNHIFNNIGGIFLKEFQTGSVIAKSKNRRRINEISLEAQNFFLKGTAAVNVVPSPVITGSSTIVGTPSEAFDSDLSNNAGIDVDIADSWMQIDFGTDIFIHYVRICAGAGGVSNVFTSYLQTSLNGSDYTTIQTWSTNLYYSVWSPWFSIDANVRYIRYYKTSPHYLRQRGMEVLLSQKPINYLQNRKRSG